MTLAVLFIALACGADEPTFELDRELRPAAKFDARDPRSRLIVHTRSLGCADDGQIVAAALSNGEVHIWHKDRPEPTVVRPRNSDAGFACVTVAPRGDDVWAVWPSDAHCLLPIGTQWKDHVLELDKDLDARATIAFCNATVSRECYVGFKRMQSLNIVGKDTWARGLQRFQLTRQGQLTTVRIPLNHVVGGLVTTDGRVLAVNEQMRMDRRMGQGVAEVRPDGSIRQLAHGPFATLLAVETDEAGKVVALGVDDFTTPNRQTWVGLVFDDGRFVKAGDAGGNADQAVAAMGPIPHSFLVGFGDGAISVVDTELSWPFSTFKAHHARVTAVAAARAARRVVTAAEDGSLRVWRVKTSKG